MNAVGKFLVVAAVVMLAACFLSPAVFWLVKGNPDAIPGLAGFPFHRFFSRIFQICAVVGAVWLFFWLGLRRPSDLGLEASARWWKDLGWGLLFAFGSGMLLAAGLLAAGWFKVRSGLEPGPWLRILGTAAGVSLLEEFLFRGVMLGLCVRAMGAWAGATVVSAVFAAVHFLRPSRTAVAEVTWWSGVEQALSVFHAWPPWPLWAWGFATLFAAGLLLAWSVLRTRALWLAMGLHAGWILAQQGLNWLARPASRAVEDMLPWLGPRLVSGVVPTGIWPLAALALTALLTAVHLRRSGRG